MKLELPGTFVQTITSTYPNGQAWLGELPGLVAEAARRWGLSQVQPVDHLSYNFVAYAQRGDSEVVLKIGPPNRELRSELATLRVYRGQGAVRLLAWDSEHCAFLLERLRPGRMLAELSDDDAATHVAAEVMEHLWRPPPDPGGEHLLLSDWFDGLKQIRLEFAGGTGPFPPDLVARVEKALPWLFAEGGAPILLHGDFHHFNVLSSARGWLAIDPKGVIGPRGYECGPMLLNPWPALLQRADALSMTSRRIAILSERLGLARPVIREWGVCHALLSAWWDLGEAHESGGEYALACAGVIARAAV